MNQKKITAILDFAIEKEWEAVKFYNRLIQRAGSFEMMEAIREIEMFERRHVEKLEVFKKTGKEQLAISAPENLQISEYLTAPATDELASYRDILLTAMKREEASWQLYVQIATASADPQVQKVFKKLATEEANHKTFFEKIYDTEALKEN